MIEEEGGGLPAAEDPLSSSQGVPPIVLARWSFKGGKSQHSDEWGGRRNRARRGQEKKKKRKEGDSVTWQKSGRCFLPPLLFSLSSYKAAVTPGGEGGGENNGGGRELGCRDASLHGPSDFSSSSSSSGISSCLLQDTRSYVRGNEKTEGEGIAPFIPMLLPPSISSATLPPRPLRSLIDWKCHSQGERGKRGGGIANTASPSKKVNLKYGIFPQKSLLFCHFFANKKLKFSASLLVIK